MLTNDAPHNTRPESDARYQETGKSAHPSLDSQEVRPEDSVRFREANVGDRGYVLGALSHDGSGLMRLAIQIEMDEIAFLSGDWRSIQQIVHDLAKQEIEVIESQGSPWGFHDVCSVATEAADDD